MDFVVVGDYASYKDSNNCYQFDNCHFKRRKFCINVLQNVADKLSKTVF